MSRRWVDFRAVKEAVGLATVLRGYQVEGLKRSGRSDHLRGRCPLHGRGGEDAFHANLTKNIFRCFHCQAQGNVLDLVAAMEKCSLREAALRLQERFCGAPLPQPANMPEKQESELVPKKESNRPLRFALTPLDRRHPYLKQRAIEGATADYFDVGWYNGPGLMSGRVAIPIHDEQGTRVAYCGRAIDEATPQYKLPAGFRKSLVLFNLHRAASFRQDTVIVVEGFFDCMKVHQAGFPAVVALMGATLSMPQEELLLRRFSSVVLLLDGDATGRAASSLIAARLAGKVKCCVTCTLPMDSQPDQLSTNQIRSVLAFARNMFDHG